MSDDTAVIPSPPNKLGKYEIRKMLGKGNMGMVYLAHDPVLERDVAIKVMAGSTIYDAQLRERFAREAKSVARLQHPNIVTIHDLGYDHQSSPFIAMELLEGADLDDLVKQNALSVTRRLEIVAQVCRGLHHAHSVGIVHRDVKPANIFVTKDGAKIMDFGVARWTQSSQTQSGMVLGTVSYMSPEQIRGEKVDGRSDIFSAGTVLYLLLTNEKLFSGDSIETIFFQTLTKAPPKLVRPGGGDLPGLQAILSTSLAKDVGGRYSNAEEMATAIETFLRDHSAALPEKPDFRPLDSGSAPQSSGGSGSVQQISHEDKPLSGMPADQIVASAMTAAQTAPYEVMAPSEVKAAPPEPRKFARWLPWAGVFILIASVVGIYFIVFHQPDSPRPAESSSELTPSPVDLEGRFRLAEELLGSGQIAQAFEAVQNILMIAPGNPRALELQTAIEKAAQEQAESKTAHTTTTIGKSPVASTTPTPRERAAAFAADAALALSNGRLEEAESLVARGERLTPESPRWSKLRDQLRAMQAEAELKSFAAKYLQEGRSSLEEGDYPGAIDAFKKAMEYEPENRDAQNGLEEAISLKHESELEPQVAAAPVRRIVESETEYTPSQSGTEEVMGFEMEDRFKVNETAADFFPAQIIIELNPTDAKPGEPYVLRVRIFNEGYRAIEIRNLELVSRFGGKTIGKGAEISPRTRRVDPQATALVHEIAGTWTEAQHQGEIEATITLADGGKFSKSIRW
jgi:serine/threonine protein kinase/tetratricopeptide (TPR) repeat protein